ncbi:MULTISPECIES: GNAT family N-acetyltransferase [Brevibacillus]|uniref:GNAT family N-acetyltransferase n=1 Tax=Brevibacillus TaxID=55080 RepID=UPI002859B071|nr:GNAT family N-acetyltransferase [Brevibacillus nitrificans]MDR7317742.1 ribosomal protein S18 acetylase RimI-like enzyme [Brevibacillus nitrificans]
MANKPIEIVERPPTSMEHQLLWEAVGWGKYHAEMAEKSLANSLYCLVVQSEGNAVGMGRIVGDGAMYFYIQDVAVLPEYQGKGIGKQITDKLLAYIQNTCAGPAFVGLFAAQGKEEFYQRFGFMDHSPGMTGMFLVMEKATSL